MLFITHGTSIPSYQDQPPHLWSEYKLASGTTGAQSVIRLPSRTSIVSLRTEFPGGPINIVQSNQLPHPQEREQSGDVEDHPGSPLNSQTFEERIPTTPEKWVQESLGQIIATHLPHTPTKLIRLLSPLPDGLPPTPGWRMTRTSVDRSRVQAVALGHDERRDRVRRKLIRHNPPLASSLG